MGRKLGNKLDIFLYIDEAARNAKNTNQHTAATCSSGGFARYDIFISAATEQGRFTRNSETKMLSLLTKNENVKGKHGTKKNTYPR